MIKPSKLPEWASQPYIDPVVGGSNIVEPAQAQKDTGWLRKQYPPANYMNWLQNLHYQWLLYLDAAEALQRPFFGCLPANNDIAPTTDTDIEPGTWKAEVTGNIYKLPSTITKRITVDWEENPGVAHGGFPSLLTLTNDTWYHKFLIAKLDGTQDAGYDTALNAANLLGDASGSDYIDYKGVGSFRYLTADIERYTAIEDVSTGRRSFFWHAKAGVNTFAIPDSPEFVTIHVPPDIIVNAHLHGFTEEPTGAATGTSEIFIYSPLVADPSGIPVVDANRNTLSARREINKIEYLTANDFDIYTNTTQQIKYYAIFTSITSSEFTINVKGWSE